MIDTVTISKSDNNKDMPNATTYWRIKPLLIRTCLEVSNPPKIPFNPLAIKNMDNINPEDNKPESLLLRISVMIL